MSCSYENACHYTTTVHVHVYNTLQVEPCVNKAIQLLRGLRKQLEEQPCLDKCHEPVKGGGVSTVMWGDEEVVRERSSEGTAFSNTKEFLCIEGACIIV